MLAVFTVNSLLDNGDGANTTLREAVDFANESQDAQDIIKYDQAVFANGGTIELTQGELSISENNQLIIDGRNGTGVPLGITIDAGGGTNGVVGNFDGHTVFDIEGSGQIEINGLTLTGGDAFIGYGGAITSGRLTSPSVILKNSTVSGNASFADGGGIWAYGILRVENSTITGNWTGNNNGGGIFFWGLPGQVLNVVSSTISGNQARAGGGIYVFDALVSVNIQSSHITGNQAQERGGGIRFTGKELNVHSSTISDNHAGFSGGGLYGRATNGSIIIDHTNFDVNTSTGDNSFGGGAFLSSDNSSVRITDTTISNNQVLGFEANVGGISVKAKNDSNVLIDRVRIIGNHADDDIGGLYIQNGDPELVTPASVVTVKNSTISGNTAAHNAGYPAYQAAAGAWLQAFDGGSNIIEYSTISENRTITTPDSGDNVPGAGLFVQNSNETGTTTTIRNTTISGNEATGSGGGIKVGKSGNYFQSGGQLLIQHCTITNNRANSDDDGTDQGGGIDVGISATTVTIEHTIVAGNFRGTGSTRDDISGAVAAVWSLIGDNTGATITNNGGNQIGTFAAPIDPQLMPLANNGGATQTHRPRATSPVIDAGNPAAMAGTPPTPVFDQRGPGFPRIYDVPGVTIVGKGPIDIGAYEVGPVGLAKIIDVRLSGVQPNGQPWVRQPWSFADLVPLGLQHAPIYSAGPNNTSGVNKIEVMFSEAVTFAAGQEALALKILSDNDMPISQTIGWGGYNSMTFVATWTLSSPLQAGKYALQVNGVKGPNNLGLDGEWVNFDGPDENSHTPDNFSDDKKLVVLRSGDDLAGGVFDLHFSVLPGDYNQDGIVTSEDAVASVVKDGDGDGVIENGLGGTSTEDLVLASTTYAGTRLPLRKNSGDYNDDEIVDGDDYRAWAMTFGNTGPDLPADGNGNGQIDAADYVLWRNDVGAFSAWYTGSAPSVAGIAFVDFGNAPRVANVIVSGSQSTHDPHSFDDWDYNGLQIQRVPVAEADTISIVFSEDVNAVASDLRVVGLYTANLPTLAEFSYDMATMTATWRFENWASADMYVIQLDDAVTDVEGNRLDGEWVNPRTLWSSNGAVSEFPSGNGQAGGDFNFVMTLLPGDASGNGIVDYSDYDYLYWSWYYGLQNAGLEDGDCDGDGVITSADFDIWSENYGTVLTTIAVLGDLNGDFAVDQLDVDIFMYNPTSADCDLNNDGVLNTDDLDLIFAQYGLELSVVG